jgi:ribosome-binding factor A
MRIVPKIIFQEEKKEQEADRVDKLLNEIKKEEDS